MHLIKDESGNVIQHGHGASAHHHHDGAECSHGHSHDSCSKCQKGEPCPDETFALLTYMVQHNEHHAMELDQMADNLIKLGMNDAAKTIKEGVADFQKANLRFSLALTQVKGHVEEA